MIPENKKNAYDKIVKLKRGQVIEPVEGPMIIAHASRTLFHLFVMFVDARTGYAYTGRYLWLLGKCPMDEASFRGFYDIAIGHASRTDIAYHEDNFIVGSYAAGELRKKLDLHLGNCEVVGVPTNASMTLVNNLDGGAVFEMIIRTEFSHPALKVQYVAYSLQEMGLRPSEIPF